MLQDDWNHRETKRDCEWHYAKDFEAHPEVGREIAPDDFVDRGEVNEKADPRPRDDPPTAIGEIKRAFEHELDEEASGQYAEEQDHREQRVDDRWLKLDEQINFYIEYWKKENK